MAMTELEELELEQLQREKKKRKGGFSEFVSKTMKSMVKPVIPGETIREVPGILTSAASTLAFGIPKAAFEHQVKKGTPGARAAKEFVFPEQKTILGKGLRIGAEGTALFTGGAAKLAKGAVGLIPKVSGGVGLRHAPGAVNARRKSVLLRKALKGSAAGGTFGGTQLAEDPTFKGQAERAAVGTAIGFGFEKFAEPIKRGVRGFRKFRTPTKTPAVQTVKESTKESGKITLSELKQKKEEALARISKTTSSLRAEHKETVGLQNRYIKEQLDETASTLKNNVAILEENLQTTSEVVSKRIQKDLPKFYKENSKAYGETLDDISNTLVSQGDDITIAEIDDILNNVVKDMDDALIEGRSREAVLALKDKYGIKFIGGQQPIKTTALKSNADDAVPFKEFVDDLKTVKKSLSAGAQSGSTRFTQEDVAVSLLNRNLGEFLKIRVPQYAKLQSEYAPIINAMKVSNKIFKPFKGEFETKTGTQFLKRLAVGKTEAGEEALISAIEGGGGFAKGVGGVTKGVLKVGQELTAAKQRIQPILNKMKFKSIKKQVDVDKVFLKKLQDLSKQKEFIKSNFLQKEQMIKEKLGGRLKELGLRGDTIQNILKDKAKVQKVLNILLKIGFITGGIAAGRKFLFNRSSGDDFGGGFSDRAGE